MSSRGHESTGELVQNASQIFSFVFNSMALFSGDRGRTVPPIEMKMIPADEMHDVGLSFALCRSMPLFPDVLEQDEPGVLPSLPLCAFWVAGLHIHQK